MRRVNKSISRREFLQKTGFSLSSAALYEAMSAADILPSSISYAEAVLGVNSLGSIVVWSSSVLELQG